MTLAVYLLLCARRLHDLRGTPVLALDLFLQMRYHDLGQAFPHDTFSVGQATLDFFDVAVGHLGGQPFGKTDGPPSIYEANYRRWIEMHRLG